MRRVSHDEFWAAVMSCQENIHPYPQGRSPFTTIWRVVATQQEWGRVVPGEDGETHFLDR